MDGYSRVKLLGEGSFGSVFLMREKKLGGRLVCVKEIYRAHYPKRSAFASRAKSVDVEVDLMKKLRHPNLIRLLSSFGGNLTTSRLPTLVASMLSAQPDLRPSVDQLLRDSIARVHIRRYCVDRLRSTDMTEEEQRVLFQQMTVLGNDTKMNSSVIASEGNNATAIRMDAYSRHNVRYDRDREDREKKLIERERQDQIQFALEKLQQLRLQFPAVCHSELIDKDAHRTNEEIDEVKSPALAIKLDLCKAPLYDEKWREPVRAANETPRTVGRIQQRASVNLGRSNSVPKELIFTGIPRVGVPLTRMAKTFAARRPVCRDIRALRRKEAAKAAERYKCRLDAMNTP
ncbi:hypothetical protein PC129_g8021 [Phytophthora cactorum]|uniref:non-specific serine/threonine protein kinase n=1 Tax=Phytophthora cactorum TaxID=29920 RepID=A0A8T1IAE2_9STRA|nr:hypothetical protein PC129_g8021 [Phytophthora cactorum]KAG4055921.1 hypothetical protein PC123_g9021 [Phytophthora cactorum]